MDQFTAVAKARATWALFAEAMQKGRDILARAGIVEQPPPVPEFDDIYPRLGPDLKAKLYADLEALETLPTTVDALRIWQPLIKSLAGKTTPGH